MAAAWAASTVANFAANRIQNAIWNHSSDILSAAYHGVPPPSLLSVGSSAGFLGKVPLVSTQRAHARTREIDAQLQRLVQSLPIYPTAEPQPPRQLRNTFFGHLTVLADNRQGECNYCVFPTLPVDWLDESILQFYDVATDGVTHQTAAHIDYLDRHLLLRNMADTRCELDVWLLWPKDDVPSSDLNTYDYTYFVANDYSAPPVLTYPYGTDQIPTASAGYSTSADWKTTERFHWNDWNASPMENIWLQQFFRPQHKVHCFMNPGDEIEFTWGLPTGQLVFPFKDLLLNAGELKNTYPYYGTYSYMRRCGPLVCVRARGRMSHNEDLQTGTTVGTGNNFGLFNLEYALITKTQMRPMYGDPDYNVNHRATVPSGARPSSVNKCVAAKSNQWFAKAPFEDSAAS